MDTGDGDTVSPNIFILPLALISTFLKLITPLIKIYGLALYLLKQGKNAITLAALSLRTDVLLEFHHMMKFWTDSCSFSFYHTLWYDNYPSIYML